MIRSSTLKSVLVLLIAMIAGLVVACAPAEAQVRPFAITGQGIAPLGLPLPTQPARPHTIVGNATYLGSHHGQGSVVTDTANFLPNGIITGQFGSGGPFNFVGQNGDILSCEYGRVEFGATTPGTFQLVPVPPIGSGVYRAYFVAQFVPQPAQCTGMFAGVTGNWVMYASTDPFVLGSTAPLKYSWTGSGALIFKAGK